MVLESGLVKEFDSPNQLLMKPKGLFKLLWERHQQSHEQ
jgi:ABC-type multidrug transport system fused ATPase/permease subunit